MTTSKAGGFSRGNKIDLLYGKNSSEVSEKENIKILKKLINIP